MEEIKPGNVLYSDDGHEYAVLQVFENGLSCFRIITKDGGVIHPMVWISLEVAKEWKLQRESNGFKKKFYI